MDNWDDYFLDLVEQAHLTFRGEVDGEIAFGALKGSWTCAMARATAPPAPSSLGRHDENDNACGRRWVVIGIDGRLVGHFISTTEGVRLRL